MLALGDTGHRIAWCRLQRRDLAARPAPAAQD